MATEQNTPVSPAPRTRAKRELTVRQRPGTVTRFLGEMDRPFLIIVLLLVVFT